jgi:hypothetical protein
MFKPARHTIHPRRPLEPLVSCLDRKRVWQERDVMSDARQLKKKGKHTTRLECVASHPPYRARGCMVHNITAIR